MGPTLQWRSEPEDRDNRSFSATVTFGGFRDRGAGYMVYASRVGPGVLVLSGSPAQGAFRAHLDAMNDDGFTVLAPGLSSARSPNDVAAMLRAAASHLTDNWHPRLGVIAFGDVCALAFEVEADATILYGGLPDVEARPRGGALLGHFAQEGDVPEADVNEWFAALRVAGVDAQAVIHPGTTYGFADPASAQYEADAASAAHAHTSDFLQHHLS
jgi:dienelactone hydrolase